jgi:(p)ppGpp synthase/HD superfamily hydrolase
MLARESHAGQGSRFGEPVIEHVERVTAAVPPEARTTALLHDLLECGRISRTKLRRHGLSAVELRALTLLTHAADEPYGP